jgi:hypothetical protein
MGSTDYDVIPDCHVAASPESIAAILAADTSACGYGFRARPFGLPGMTQCSCTNPE